LKELKCDKSTF